MRGSLMAAAWVVLAAGCAGAHTAPTVDAGADAPMSMADAAPIPDGPFKTTEGGVGGYKLGAPLLPNEAPGMLPACNTISGVVRDFKGALPAMSGEAQPGGHPDFEVFEGRGVTKGLVADTLGPDRKPVYTGLCELGKTAVSTICPFGAMTTTKANFDQWYRSVEGVNLPYRAYFELSDRDPTSGISTFSSNKFFPLDGFGWGNSGIDFDMKTPRNYSFTTEIHTTFKYNGGETFKFEGDDDVWIFINGKLAVDLGGLHLSEKGSVDLDQSAAALGITKGSIYPLDLFHAERHSVDSDFRIDLNFVFESCGYIVP
jgi:fibro-slime domain-containing protein